MVSIVTVNFNQRDLSFALLDSIRRQDYQDLEVILVDNGSDEDPTADLQRRYPEVKCLRSEKNLGFAGGNNLALPMAKGDYVFFVNNDAEIPNGCIAQLVQLLQSKPQAAIVSPLICYFPAPGQPNIIQYAGMPRVSPISSRSVMEGKGQSDTGQYSLPFQTGYAHGAAMMLPRQVIETVGPMSEDYFLYYEEVDWCERMHQAGYEVWVEPRAVIWHKESMTMQALGTQKTYFHAKNRVLFMRRHYKATFVFFLLFLAFVTVPRHVLGYLLKGDWKNMRAFLGGICSNFLSKPSAQ